MKLPPLTVIEASAGTGKTFSLVTRLLHLIFNGTDPERIVALTFSRMAAGEIFNSFIERLSKAAKDENVALAESKILGRNLASADFTAKLREVISRQHLSLIGTLDSFMMKIVRMIPLELGLEGEVTIMSEYRDPVERVRLAGDMLMRQTPEAKSIFRQAFRLAFNGSGAKSFLEEFSDFITKWHHTYRDLCESESLAKLPESERLQALVRAWGDPERIWGGEVPAGLDVSVADIRIMADLLADKASARGAAAFIEAVRGFDGTVPKLPRALAEDPVANEALEKMLAWKKAASLKMTQGVFLLMHAYESAYASNVRSRGLVTFDDLPRLLNSLPEGTRLPLEYRMDSHFEHWALDEFQDTSRGQWRALENLIGEASLPGSGRSVFVVGDRKQSIYEWRGGDVEILGGEVERAKRDGNRLEALDESYRYVSVISKAVSDVFRENAVMGALDMDDAPASAKWQCRDHKSFDKTTEGFVQVIQAMKAGRQASISDFLKPLEDALNAVKPWERGIATAILVRKNDIGETVLRYLKSKGISKVVFEGDSAVSDSPALAAMMDLVKLAEHANDAFAYSHVKYSPIAEAMYPHGLPPPAELSAQLLSDFTKYGMARKFRDVREALKRVPGTWNDFTESRFEDFIKCAAEFEEIRDASMRLSDFIDFVSRKRRRDFAEPGMVRIMTMHQSKGLGFDWVLIPFFEPEKMIGERHVGPLRNYDPDWIMINPGSSVDMTDPVLAKTEKRRQQIQIYNSLCLNYVAMTRAKKALTVILHPENARPPLRPERFSDLVRHVGLKTDGNPLWYAKMKPDGADAVSGSPPVPGRARRKNVRKFRPSESFYEGLGGDVLFDENFGVSARRGSEAHEKYERIEWLDAAADDFDRAFLKPDGFLALWREKTYELFVDGKWETGQFDRVVFTEKDGVKKAVVYDFKTNGIASGETVRKFEERMAGIYARQMESYRRALSSLTGIGTDCIKTVLLLESSRSQVEL